MAKDSFKTYTFNRGLPEGRSAIYQAEGRGVILPGPAPRLQIPPAPRESGRRTITQTTAWSHYSDLGMALAWVVL